VIVSEKLFYFGDKIKVHGREKNKTTKIR